MSSAGFELRRVAPDAVARDPRPPVEAETLAQAARIVEAVRTGGIDALREHAERLDDLAPGAPLLVAREQLERALRGLPKDQRRLLERTAARIRAFAEAQRETLRPLDVAVPGGRAGQSVAPVERAGCYAPGGRHPLPSSALMTAVTARAAGVETVWVASPRPAPVTLAAAALAGVDGLLAAGGAQAIAALAFGVEGLPAVDLIAGPGNRWVTAAKQLVYGQVGIDMLAGPSELVVLADDTADPATVAADLIAQAEHDEDALAVLVTTHAPLVVEVERELAVQLEALGSLTAERALLSGFAVLASSLDEAARACDALAPEHLELVVADPGALAPRLRHHGALFLGPLAAEVFGDYGVGPNHVLPTGRGARFTGGLSVHTFLRVRTWLELDEPKAAAELARDAAALARLEGLEGHARSAERRA